MKTSKTVPFCDMLDRTFSGRTVEGDRNSDPDSPHTQLKLGICKQCSRFLISRLLRLTFGFGKAGNLRHIRRLIFIGTVGADAGYQQGASKLQKNFTVASHLTCSSLWSRLIKPLQKTATVWGSVARYLARTFSKTGNTKTKQYGSSFNSAGNSVCKPRWL